LDQSRNALVSLPVVLKFLSLFVKTQVQGVLNIKVEKLKIIPGFLFYGLFLSYCVVSNLVRLSCLNRTVFLGTSFTG
jgi:hypothetical protein